MNSLQIKNCMKLKMLKNVCKSLTVNKPFYFSQTDKCPQPDMHTGIHNNAIAFMQYNYAASHVQVKLTKSNLVESNYNINKIRT